MIHGQVMHSPGPMLYWLLALPARYGSVASLAVTMCVINTLAIVSCVALARRRGGLVLMFAAAFGISLMCQSLPARGDARHLEPGGGAVPVPGAGLRRLVAGLRGIPPAAAVAALLSSFVSRPT